MTNNQSILAAAIRRYAVEETTMLTPAERQNHIAEAVDHYISKEHGAEFVIPRQQPPIEKSWMERFVSMRGKEIDLEDDMRGMR